MSTVFIYALKDPDTGQIRYVGVAVDLTKRIANHMSEARRSKQNFHRLCWIRSLLATGTAPVLEAIDEVPEYEWRQWEVAYIEYFRECGCDLVNGARGGEGGSEKCSPETRAKISAAHLGKKRLPFSSEHRAKIGAAHAGKKLSPEHCAKVSAARVGKKASIDTRTKMSVTHTGDKNPMFGKKRSPEHWAKMNAARDLYWEKKRQAEVLSEMWR